MARFRPLKASQYQRKDDPVRLIAEAGQKKLAASIAAAFRHLRKTISKEQIADRIRARDYRGAGAQELERFRDGLQHPFAQIAAIYRASGERVAQRLTRQLRHVRSVRKDTTPSGGPGGVYAFDLYTPEVVDQLSDYQDAFITALTDDQRQAVLDAIVSGVQAGESADDIAADIVTNIGLTDRQAQAVANLATMLANGDSAALTRSLLDDPDVALIQDALDAGQTLSDVTIDDIVSNYADNMLDYRADMISQTESVRASNLGLQDAYGQAIDRGVFPADAVKKFWLTALDERVCPICRPIPARHKDGIDVNGAFETSAGQIEYPPAHPNCLPGDALVAAEGVTAASKRWYDGDLVIIHTASGKQLSCTPNHPVLTPSGWIAARLINIGGHVVSDLNGNWAATGNVQHKNVPSRIEDIAEAFGRTEQVSAAPMPIAPEDFHGDGIGSKVAVIWANRVLWRGRDASISKKSRQDKFVVCGVKTLLHHCSRVFELCRNAYLAASRGLVGSGNLLVPLFLSHLSPLCRLSFALVPNADLHCNKSPPDRVSTNAKTGSDCIFGDATFVELPDLLVRQLHASHFDDAVVDVQLAKFSGYVFNLQTKSGFYVANGIYTHNCRCSIQMVTDLDQLDNQEAA